MVGIAGLEPATQGLWVLCSHQLSYMPSIYILYIENHHILKRNFIVFYICYVILFIKKEYGNIKRIK